MTAPNDANIVRVMTKETTSTIAQEAIQVGKAWEVVVEVEAGIPLHSSGTKYEVGGVIRDLSTGSATPLTKISNNFPSAPWNTPADTLKFSPANLSAAQADHLFQVLVYVKTNALAPYDISFAESPVFMAFVNAAALAFRGNPERHLTQ